MSNYKNFNKKHSTRSWSRRDSSIGRIQLQKRTTRHFVLFLKKGRRRQRCSESSEEWLLLGHLALIQLNFKISDSILFLLWASSHTHAHTREGRDSPNPHRTPSSRNPPKDSADVAAASKSPESPSYEVVVVVFEDHRRRDKVSIAREPRERAQLLSSSSHLPDLLLHTLRHRAIPGTNQHR